MGALRDRGKEEERKMTKEMSAGSFGWLQNPSRRGTIINRGLAVFGIAVVVSLAGCSATSNGASSSRSALDAALQPSDVGQLYRCALSGTVTNAIDALRTQGATDQASRLETTWSGLKVGGAQDA